MATWTECSSSLGRPEEPESLEEAEIIAAAPVLDDSAVVGDPPNIDMAYGETPSGRIATRERAGVAPPHDDALDDFVAFGDLVLDLEAEVAEHSSKLLNGLSYAVRPGRKLRMTGFVVYELGMDQFVQERDVALGIDLLESMASCALVVAGRPCRNRSASIVRHHVMITAPSR